MKSRRSKSERPTAVEAPAAPDAASSLLATRLRAGLAAAAVALLVASVLVPSEGAIREGVFAPLAMGWCLVGLLWAVSLWLPPQKTLLCGWFEVAGLAFVAWHTLAALAWLGAAHDRQTLNALWLMVGYGLTVFLLRQIGQRAEQARALLAVFVALAAALSVCGLEEYLISKPAILARYRANPEAFLSANGVPSDPQSPERQRFENRLRSVEPLATFSLTNSLAGFLTPWLLVTFGIGMAALTLAGQRRALIAAVTVAILITACLLLTKSRTGVLACIAGGGLLLLYGRRGGWQIGWRIPAAAVAVLTAIGLVAVFAGGLDWEVLSEAPKSVLYRLEYWRATAAMIADYPLLGCGPGNFQETYAAYKLPQASETVADPHNFLLEIWATTGTPGILLLLATIGGLVADLVRGSQLPVPVESRLSSVAETRWPVYAGAAAGTLLAAPTAALVGFSPGIPEWLRGVAPLPTVWIVGLPVLALALWALDNWVRRGELPVGNVLVALFALSMNLLAAGAVVFPGVMASALALAAVALTLVRSPETAADSPPAPIRLQRARGHRRQGRQSAWAAGMVLLLLTLACLWSEYRPVVTGKLNFEEAVALLGLGRAEQAERAAVEATAADRWWAEPRRLVADLRQQRYLQTGDPDDLAQFLKAMHDFQERNPRHHSQHFQRGNWLLAVWRKSNQDKYLEDSIAAYGEATKQFPAQALYHAQLAWALHLAENEDAARLAASHARQLDEASPHADQKLRNFRLLDPRISQQGMELRRSETAEQTIETLRIGTRTERTP